MLIRKWSMVCPSFYIVVAGDLWSVLRTCCSAHLSQTQAWHRQSVGGGGLASSSYSAVLLLVSIVVDVLFGPISYCCLVDLLLVCCF